MSEEEKVVLRIIQDNIEEQVDMDTYISDIALNSLSFIKIIVAIEGKTNIEVDDEYLDVNQFIKVGDLVKLISSMIK